MKRWFHDLAKVREPGPSDLLGLLIDVEDLLATVLDDDILLGRLWRDDCTGQSRFRREVQRVGVAESVQSEYHVVLQPAHRGHAKLVVYDLAGRRVKTLVDGFMNAGGHESPWNGRDDAGRQVASGTYIYMLRAGSHVETSRMVLLK